MAGTVSASHSPAARAAAAMDASLLGDPVVTEAGPAAKVGLAGLAKLAPAQITVGIATLTATPDAPKLAALRALGLEVQGMKHLPLAIVKGPVAALRTAVESGVADEARLATAQRTSSRASLSTSNATRIRPATA